MRARLVERHDLGAEADERIEYSAPHESFLVHIESEEAPEEDDAVTEALAFLDDRAARLLTSSNNKGLAHAH
jgi:hypothetical protein